MDDCGIYKIENIVNNKCYIGSSINIKNRLKCHKRDLINNKHPNKRLQNSFNKYGINNFIFETICICEKNKEMLLNIETYYIGLYGYFNIMKIANSPYGLKLSEEAKKKISKSLIGNTRNKGKKGFKHTEAAKNIIRKKLKGRIFNEETKKKMSIGQKNYYNNGGKNARKGVKLSEETIKKLIKINSGIKKSDKILNTKQRRNLKKKKYILCYDLDLNFIKEFNSQIEICHEFNLSPGNLCSVLQGNRHSCGGYIFKYKDDQTPPTI